MIQQCSSTCNHILNIFYAKNFPLKRLDICCSYPLTSYFPSSVLAIDAVVQGSEKTIFNRFSGKVHRIKVAYNVISYTGVM